MILKVDHVSLSSTDFSEAERDLSRFGYQKQFEEKGMKNAEIKKPLLHSWSKEHDLALFSQKDSIAIELLNHGSIRHDVRSFFVPILTGEAPVLQGLLARAKDLAKSESFWGYFGFQCILKGDDYRILKFISPLQAASCTLYLVRSSEPAQKTKLDDAGFPSIAFISNDVGREKEVLDKKNIQTTAVEQLVVHNKTFDICFAQGSQGEIVELLSLDKKYSS
ncbi:MAG: hypothetical protein Q7R55_00555 [Candidatus Wildermuthbacteria bacterium]|nr:hypothetical protein [Candidatus Wildermuthbacteria bacterium]